jgi:predicted Zn-dependent protease
MNIHVWPTTLVVKSDGTQVAHLAGMPKSFATDLKAYLEYAGGKLDDAALQKRLTTEDVITDSPAQIASRHLQIAQRLLEQGQIDQAQSELNEGLKRVANDPMLQLTMARVLVLKNQPKDALDLLDKLPSGSTPAWQGSLIRGRALIALEIWADAKAVLPDALKLNPDPSEAHYLLGLCYQHEQDWPHAAEQFKLAFEKSSSGSKLINKQP